MPGPVRRLAGTLALKLGRWGVVPLRGELPPKSIMLGYPHTSNWDFVWLKASSWHYGIDIAFLGKRELFRGPLGWLLTTLGGVPVDRAGSGQMVERMAKEFASRDRLVLCIPPEGTRHYVEAWRSGFYYMALGAKVPLLLSLLDYTRRHIEVSEPIDLTGNVAADMDRVRAFYAGAEGRFPQKTGAVRLREE